MSLIECRMCGTKFDTEEDTYVVIPSNGNEFNCGCVLTEEYDDVVDYVPSGFKFKKKVKLDIGEDAQDEGYDHIPFTGYD